MFLMSNDSVVETHDGMELMGISRSCVWIVSLNLDEVCASETCYC